MTGSQDGQAGVEAVAFGFVLFVLGTLVVVNAWAVVDGKLVAAAAAREAGRTYSESVEDQATASAQALRAAREAIEAHGRDWRRTKVTARTERGFARCGRHVVEVTYDVPLVAIPFVGQLGGGMRVSARHSEIVDPYRSGPAGTAAC